MKHFAPNLMISKAFFVNQIYSVSILVILGMVGGLSPQIAKAQESEPLQLKWSKEAGIHSQAIYLRITCNDPTATIHFTTDGNKPSTKSTVAKRGISIKRTSLIKARAIKGDQKSEVETRTFFIGEQSTFPLISLGVKPEKLFDEEDGLFRMGPKADSLFPFRGANFWSREEIKMHLEYFTSDGEQVVAQKGGMRMFGGMSRLFAQKSLALVARGDYGPKRIQYQVFRDKDIEKFKYIALRNSGSDWSKTHLRDAYFTDLVKDLDFETQAFQPTHTFINGKYWGIYNAREKINRFFLSSNCGYHKDSLEIIEHQNNVRRGNGRHYRQMIHFIEKHDLDIPANYEVV
ncbi:MAG: CotH kinase family protein, partial [Bacteroidota bacterium]